ncbi:MAG: transporter [Proteobacteria bacterium]|nr:transporter [Pseudomonadota bacterium]
MLKLKRLAVICLPLFILFSASSALAAHYEPGVEGVMAATTPPPGIHWRMYNAWMDADTLNNDDGDEANLEFDIKVFANVNRLVWGSKTRLLGADWGMDVVIPLINADLSIKVPSGPSLVDESSFGLGDITVEPLWMTWRLSRFDISGGLALVIPTGSWDAQEALNTGEGYWSGMLTLGATWYMDEAKAWTASVLTRTLVHSEQEDTDITPGAGFVAEWGVGKSFMAGKNLQIRPGVAGFGQWQLTEDSGGSANKDAQVRKYGIGPEVNFFWLPPCLFQANLRVLQEFGAQSTSEGYQVVLTLTKSF